MDSQNILSSGNVINNNFNIINNFVGVQQEPASHLHQSDNQLRTAPSELNTRLYQNDQIYNSSGSLQPV